MIVYLVFRDTIEWYDLRGVFSTREKAEQYITDFGDSYCTIAKAVMDPEGEHE